MATKKPKPAVGKTGREGATGRAPTAVTNITNRSTTEEAAVWQQVARTFDAVLDTQLRIAKALERIEARFAGNPRPVDISNQIPGVASPRPPDDGSDL